MRSFKSASRTSLKFDLIQNPVTIFPNYFEVYSTSTPRLNSVIKSSKYWEQLIPQNINTHNSRPGMQLWKILVLGVLRLNINRDYDRIHELANNHKTIRQMLGHGLFNDDLEYKLQTLKDNVSLLTPKILNQINEVVVASGHLLVKKRRLPGRAP